MHSSDSNSNVEYSMLEHSSSATMEGVINMFKSKLVKQGFKTHEIDYMAKNGFKKMRPNRRQTYPF